MKMSSSGVSTTANRGPKITASSGRRGSSIVPGMRFSASRIYISIPAAFIAPTQLLRKCMSGVLRWVTP